MKTKRILSIIGFTLLALSPTTWAAGHGGGRGDSVVVAVDEAEAAGATSAVEVAVPV